ncbi:MAG: DUF1553 domain-containing protein [Verrucomicrobia bacterium]|nr:DUF1553 domain-containing protein [Verrucomicrobiota bacterium]
MSLPRLIALACCVGTLAAAEAPTWSFDGTLPSGSENIGGVTLGQPGPRRPDYPGFDLKNVAARFNGKGAHLALADTGPDSQFDFKNGDAITLEAWVKLDGLRKGANVYLIGKGRTKAGSSNQNWALRLREMYGSACPSFLFATTPSAHDQGDDRWHRWTTKSGVVDDGRWHHVAVSYVFGDPQSVRGFVDGLEIPGAWDMGGATKEAPVNDDDAIWLGSSMGGSVNNSFAGWLDDVALHRRAVPAAELTARFKTTLPALEAVVAAPRDTSANAGNDSANNTGFKATKGAEAGAKQSSFTDWAKVPAGQVLVQLSGHWKVEKNAWPSEALPTTESYTAPAFGFFRPPHLYVATGVRGDRGSPYFFRAAAKLDLPAGKHRLLLRARGASALFINDQLVLTTPFPPSGSDDKPIKVQDKFLDLGPTFRFAPPGNREVWCEFTSTGGEQRIVLESVVGYVINAKSRRRAELGETVAAISLAGTTSWQLLSPSAPVGYDDVSWAAFAEKEEARLSALDAEHRAQARATEADYWSQRRAAAQAWLAKTPATPVPALPAGFTGANPIDAFIAEKLVGYQQTVQADTGGIDFYRQIWPIVESQCLECHQGAKAKGGLHLDTLAGALKGGKSDGPALSPKDPAKSAVWSRVCSADSEERMPPKGPGLTAADKALLQRWINAGAAWPEFRPQPTSPAPLASDLVFLRRVTFDVVGVPPTAAEIAAFEADRSADKRAKVIDRLLADPRAADAGMGLWQDVLAENPNILNPTLNNSGPFRWWIHESLLDHKPLDLMVTELVRLQGSERFGGPAGFGMASQNDVPMAAKATILTSAFLGVEAKCARCHDSPATSTKQEQVFALAALLETKGVKVPATSSVAMDKLREGGRKPLIEVTLAPGATVQPHWPFPEFATESVADELARDPHDPRDRLATLLTAPQNERFAQVMVNRLWANLMGRGLVDQANDFERSRVTHPALLRWLARELVQSGYDADHVRRLILNSHAYQRAEAPTAKAQPELYAARAPRRLSAEQVVDGLFAATGKPFRTEEASLDIDGIRESDNSISLGQPRRAWMLTSTSNERDRPALALPRIQAVCDVLAAFGWRASRPDPLTDRDLAANSLQPAILANGVMGTWLTGLSDDHGVTRLCLEAQSPEALTEDLFLRLLTRRPTAKELKLYADRLRPGFAERTLVATPMIVGPPPTRRPAYYVSWSNHLDKDATTVRQQQADAARRGDPATTRLNPAWRRQAEDALWALVNAPEFLYH